MQGRVRSAEAGSFGAKEKVTGCQGLDYREESKHSSLLGQDKVQVLVFFQGSTLLISFQRLRIMHYP